MNFFERFFGLAPDDGTGVLEAVYAGLIVLAVLAIAFRRRLASFLANRAAVHRERIKP